MALDLSRKPKGWNTPSRRESDRARHAAYYAKNRKEAIAKAIEYHAKNREARRAYKAEYYVKNREKARAYQRQYRIDNLPKLQAQDSAWRSSNSKRRLVVAAKSRAKTKLEFNITIESVTWNTHCPCCGVTLRYGGLGGPAANSASLDRLSNSGGYTIGNTWVICARCNTIKNSGTAVEHRRIADAMDKAMSARGKLTNA